MITNAIRHAVLAAMAALLPVCAHAAEGDSSWAEGFGWPGVDGPVLAVASYRGELVIGGRFRFAGGTQVNGIARWDGVAWRPLGGGILHTGFNDPFVAALTVYGNDLIVAGYFATAGGFPAANVARWTGSSWTRMGEGFDNAAQALAVVDGYLYAGGELTQSGATALGHIALWSGLDWQPVGGGLDRTPWALVAYQGDLIAAGDVTLAGGTPVNQIARWDGVAWSDVGGGTSGGLAARVRALTVFRGELIAGGEFTDAGGVPASGVAAWNDTSWRGLGDGIQPFVYALAVRDDRLIAGGWFTFAGSEPIESIAQWDGNAWAALPTRTGRSGASLSRMLVVALAVHDGELIVGGEFDMAEEILAVNVARWDGEGWWPFGWGLSDDYYVSWVSSLARYGGQLVVGGRLAHRQNTSLPSADLRAWNGADMDLLEWRIAANYTPEVQALAVYRGDLIAAGTFETIGGSTAPFLARFDGSVWSWLGVRPNSPVSALAVVGDELFAAGFFTTIGGIDAAHIARWDGTAWHALGAGLDGHVASLATYRGDLIASGPFTRAGDIPATRIARWNGSVWDSLGSGLNDLARCAVEFRSELVVGGRFTAAGTMPAAHLARWNGATWSSFAGGTSGEVTALTVFKGELIAGGFFDWADTVAAPSIAGWNGSTWRPLGSGLVDPDFDLATVYSFLPHGDTLWVGGRFETAGGIPAYNLTMWTGEPPTSPIPPTPPITSLSLDLNRPNPFAEATTFSFALPAEGRVRLTLHDLGGRVVATLVDGTLPSGPRSIVWNARSDDGEPVESGIYFARLEASGEVRLRKVALVR